MKTHPAKRLIYCCLLLFLATGVYTGCKKPLLNGTNSETLGTGINGTTTAADTLASFYSPAGVAVDAAGNIYVADYGNDLIRKITPAGIVSTVAGNGTQSSTNQTSSFASFNGPKGIAIDASGNLYVADSGNNLIREITQAGAVSILAGTDSIGSADGAAGTATFFGPAGVAVDASNNVYVADAGNNLIRKITSAGIVSTLAGSPNGTVFINPTGVAADAAGNVFVANFLNNNILEVNPAGAVSTLAGTGLQGANNGPGNTATFFFPNGIAVDAADNVYVSDGDNNLIRKITPAGMVSTLAGSGQPGAADSTGTAASFNGPSGLAVDAAGNVYVADSNNNRIRKITPAGVVTTIAGTGEPGATNGKAFAHRNMAVLKNRANNWYNLWQRPAFRLMR